MLKKILRCIGLNVTRTCKSSVYIETSTLITGVRGDRHSLILLILLIILLPGFLKHKSFLELNLWA